MKTAKVVPIFKSGDPTDVNNYRPISLLSSFGKILEKIVANKLVLFLETNKLISSLYSQYIGEHGLLPCMWTLRVWKWFPVPAEGIYKFINYIFIHIYIIYSNMNTNKTSFSFTEC